MEEIQPVSDGVERYLPHYAAVETLGDETQITVEGGEKTVREALSSASAILSETARMLYPAEFDELQRTTDIQEPDDDRASGRMDYVRLDLLSE